MTKSNLKSNLKNISLVLSIMVNLVFSGIFVGYVLAGKPIRSFPPHLNWVSDSLSEENFRTLQPLLRENAKRKRQLRHEMRTSQRALETAILIEPFDEQAVTSALKTLQDNTYNLQTNMHEQMIKVMKTLTPQQRKAAFERLNKRLGLSHNKKRQKRQHERHPNSSKPLLGE